MTANSDPHFGICRTAEGCDPVFQTGCPAGQACYVTGGASTDLQGVCFVPSTPDGGTGTPGESCAFIDSCAAGAGCLRGDLPDGGFGDTLLCRSFCTVGGADAGVADAGSMDGGVTDAGAAFTGAFTGGATCRTIVSGDAAVLVPTTPGFCQ